MLKHISTDNLSTSSPQEVFDFIVAHLRTQGCRAETDPEDDDVACQYRLGNLKCAAGCLIPDEKYEIEFEGMMWFRVSRDLGVERYHYDLIKKMQMVHDNTPVEYWEGDFQSVADSFELVLAAR